MCTVCGCGKEGAPAGDHPHHHDHHHHDHPHHHAHDHGHVRDTGRVLDFGAGAGGSHVPGMSQARIVQVETDILAENDHLAAHNRDELARRGVLALNLLSSPGSGKTTLLVRTATDLGARHRIAVIEGDQQTSLDAERIARTGASALQVNTGKGCHLDADMVHRAIARLDPAPGSVLFIENVGNLVCPAGFDLGEAARVVILSVTEGDDKPLKYPNIFRHANLMILNKLDLLPHVPFDVDRCVGHARQVNPGLEVIGLSALTGDGLADWYAWVEARAGARTATAG